MTGRTYLARLIFIIASAALWIAGAHAQDERRARIVQLAADLPALDISINGELAAADLSLGDKSTYFSLPAAAELTAAIAGTNTEVMRGALLLEAEAATIILSPGGQLSIIPDDLSPPNIGLARLLIVNALGDGARLDVVSPDDARIHGEELAPGSTLGPFVLPADRVAFNLLPADVADGAPPFTFSANLGAGTSSMLIIHGDGEEPQLLQATAATLSSEGSGRVRFVHAAQGAAPVDLKIDDRMILPSLAFANPSAHIAIPSGARQLTLSLGETVISSTKLDVRPGQLQTVAILGTPSWLELVAYPDSLRNLNESSALVSLVNAVPMSRINRLRLDSGAIVAEDLGFGEGSGAAQIAPGRHAMTLSLEIGEERGTVDVPPTRFYAGAYYNLIVLAGNAFSAPRLLIAETSLKRRLSATPVILETPAEDNQNDRADDSPPAPTSSAIFSMSLALFTW